MKLKKLLTGLLAITVLSFSSFIAFAGEKEQVRGIEDIQPIKEDMPIMDQQPLEERVAFGSFRGTVKEIRDFEPVEGAKFVSVQDANGMPANFIVSKDTYIVNNAEITVGSEVTGYYNANAPMILIYPPQYNIDVLVVESENYNVKVDVFDHDLVSSDHMLKLNIAEDTEIVLPDGTPFEGKLENRKLVVIYGVSTKSIPAQTTPTKIIVLPEEKEAPSEKEEPVGKDVSDMDIMVNNKKVNAPSAYVNKELVTMIPLKPVVKALGYDVKWNNEDKSILVGKAISLSVGKDYYTYAKMAPIQLGAVPELVDGVAYVPLIFFTEVMKVDEADISQSQIVISFTELSN